MIGVIKSYYPTEVFDNYSETGFTKTSYPKINFKII